MNCPSKRFIVAFLLVGVFCPATVGCKKSAAKKDYGKPAWQKVDPAKFAPLGEYETTLEGGKIVVFDPEGWERLPAGATKAPNGFQSVIAFKKGKATIMMTKSRDARDIPDLDGGNIEEFAEAAQQRFKTPVRMIKLGDMVGVYFARRVADAQRLSKFFDRRIVATSIDNRLFTYELIAEPGTIDGDLTNTLFAVISKTKIEETDRPGEEDKTAETVTPTPEKAAETGTKPAAVTAAAAEKPEPKKADAKKPAKPGRKGGAKDILDELDALLN